MAQTAVCEAVSADCSRDKWEVFGPRRAEVMDGVKSGQGHQQEILQCHKDGSQGEGRLLLVHVAAQYISFDSSGRGEED